MTEVLAMPEQLPEQRLHDEPADRLQMKAQSKPTNIFELAPQRQQADTNPIEEPIELVKYESAELQREPHQRQPMVTTFNHELRSYKADPTDNESDFRRSEKSESSKAASSVRGSKWNTVHKDYRLNSNIYNIAFGELQLVEESLQEGLPSEQRSRTMLPGNQRRPATSGHRTHSKPNKEAVLEQEIHQIKQELKSLRSRRIANQHHQTIDQIVHDEPENIYDYCSRMTKMEPNEQPIEVSGRRNRRSRHLRPKQTQDIGVLAKPIEFVNAPFNRIVPQRRSEHARELTFAATDAEKSETEEPKQTVGHARRHSSSLYGTLDHVEMAQPIKVVHHENNNVQISLPTMIMPRLPQMPHKDTSSKDLMQLGRRLFALFGVCTPEEKYQLNISKYNNCFSFAAKGLTILWYDTGRFYIGAYRMVKNEGQKHGKGIEYTPKRYLYDGEFKANKKSGYGSLRYPNGDSYEGQFYNGLKHGKGRLLQKNGIVYNGEWKNEKMDGFGVLELASGERYKGFFESGAQHGSGHIRFANGDEYKGEFVQGRFYGKGTYVWANGEFYQGDFVNGCKHGQGSWYSKRQDPRETYVGEYKNDKKCGFGKYNWPDGSSYQGEFENDQRHGVGILTQGRKVTKGQWCNGKLNRSFQPQPPSPQLRAYYQNAKIQKSVRKKRPETLSGLRKTIEVKRNRTPSESNTPSTTARGHRQPLPETPTKPMQFYRRLGGNC